MVTQNIMRPSFGKKTFDMGKGLLKLSVNFIRFAIIAFAASSLSGLCAEAPSTRNPYEIQDDKFPLTRIDELVFKRLQSLGIKPAQLCSEAVFVRRAYLDVIGTLPTALEAKEYLYDQNPDKRRLLIEKLLARDEFADYWAMRWGDLLRMKAEFPINLWPNAVQAYYRWVHTAIKENMPYDRFARELLTSSGSNFRVPQVNFYRAVQNKEPEGIAQAVALTLMGTRIEKWPRNRVTGMSAFFSYLGYKSTSEWKEEIVYFDPDKTNAPAFGEFPDGKRVMLAGKRDPREIFADWLINPGNPWFTRNIANRIWFWLLGRGIIHEPDDIRPDNPPSNPKLLEYLEKELISSRYDLKHLYRLILNSKVYQLASIPRTKSPEVEANFAYYPLRRLEAEVLLDAICQITGTTEQYSSPIPEPFTYLPEDQRAIALPDGSITTSFLELFGRPPRDTGLEAERNNRITPGQRLHLLNSSHIQKKIEQSPKLRALLSSKSTPREMVNGIYLTILSRFPTEAEVREIWAYSRNNSGPGREALMDLVWALINSPEFLFRH